MGHPLSKGLGVLISTDYEILVYYYIRKLGVQG